MMIRSLRPTLEGIRTGRLASVGGLSSVQLGGPFDGNHPSLEQRRVGHGVQSRREFHATPKREILPLVGAAAIFIIGRYSYRAIVRMDEEWEEYQWKLQQYEKQQAMTGSATHSSSSSGDNSSDSSASSLPETIAIDLGTIYTKLAASSSPSSSSSSTEQQSPEVIVSREGHRSFFGGILYDDDNQTLQDGPASKRGQAALEKFYYSPSSNDSSSVDHTKVTLPFFRALSGISSDSKYSLSQNLSHILSPVIRESLERLDYGRARQVVTVPVQLLTQSDDYRSAIVDALKEGDDGPQTVVVPDAVAAVWGAQRKSLLPITDVSSESNGEPHDATTMVIDVGGFMTQFSIVKRDVVVQNLTVPVGGETLVELMQDYLRTEAATSTEPLSDDRSLSALQVNARGAIMQFASSSAAKVHVPYLFADPSNHHLDMNVSRSILEGLMASHIQSDLMDGADASSSPFLSRHLPTPVDVPSLYTSVLTELLEQSALLPSSIDNILLVGGASRFPLFKQSIQQSLEMLALTGSAAAATGKEMKLIVPESTSLATELAVLGATTLIPNYDYHVIDGLQRL